jgi:hypothetical protein
MAERMASRTASELAWAEKTATELLSPLAARWRHTLRVVGRAQSFREVLNRDELAVLLAAGYLHDVGYAPDLAEVGFHPLDGACFVRGAGHERLAGLVAHRHRLLDGEQETKNERSSGSVPITPQLARELKAHRLRKGQPGPDRLVFTAGDGRRIDEANYRRRILDPACVLAGIPPIGFHVLRHTHDRRRGDEGRTSGPATSAACVRVVHAGDVRPPA